MGASSPISGGSSVYRVSASRELVVDPVPVDVDGGAARDRDPVPSRRFQDVGRAHHVGGEIEQRILDADGDRRLGGGVDDVVAARRAVDELVQIPHVGAHHLDAELLEEVPVVVARGVGVVSGAKQLGLGHVVVGDGLPAPLEEVLADVGSEKPTAAGHEHLHGAPPSPHPVEIIYRRRSACGLTAIHAKRRMISRIASGWTNATHAGENTGDPRRTGGILERGRALKQPAASGGVSGSWRALLFLPLMAVLLFFSFPAAQRQGIGVLTHLQRSAEQRFAARTTRLRPAHPGCRTARSTR